MSNEDILEEEEEGEEGEWVMSMARGVGTAVASVSTALKRVAAGVPMRAPAPRKRRGKDIGLLLRDLGELVAAHRDNGFETLEHDPEFWRLIGQLRRTPRRPRFQPSGEVIDAEVKHTSERSET